MTDLNNLWAKNNGTFEVDLGIQHHFSSGVYCKQMHLPAGATMGKHKHGFDHLSVLGKGTVLVEADNWAKIFHAPACIEIKANTHHMIRALEDATWFCIHATDVTDADQIDETLIGEDTCQQHG